MKRAWSILCAFLVILALMMVGMMAADAHTTEEWDAWETDWNQRVATAATNRGVIPYTLLQERAGMFARHPQPMPLPLSAASGPIVNLHGHTGMGNGTTDVEMWRSVVAAYFGPNTEAALAVIRCESGGNAHALNMEGSGASGLFQFLPSTWVATTGDDYPGGVFDGNDNIAAAWKLSQGGTNWGPWACKP